MGAAALVQAATYSVATSSLLKTWPLDPDHRDPYAEAVWVAIDFGQTFSAPLSGIRFEISGHIDFPENIDNTGTTVQATPYTAFEIGPNVQSSWLGTGMPFKTQSDTGVKDVWGDNSELRSFTLDASGNFTSSVVFNNTGRNTGGSYFSAFENGDGAIALGLAYDGFGAYMNGQTFSKAGSIDLTSAVLSVSTDEFLQPSPVPEPGQATLYLLGLGLLLPLAKRRTLHA
jgi:hypothetical protein